VDADGARQAYHDANDLPVALAPAWGFCAADDPGWRSTMSFAFGPANPGWVAGRRPGLGSAHTGGVWTLGDLQAWIRARAMGDEAGAAAALGRLEEVAFADGMLPEAYDPDDASPIRHWFAWPGAALAALRLFEDRSPRTPDPEHPERIASAP
jgi:meiotically up-regulated gene 157 (Mug157) protein